jgi:hypothetical protein
MNSAAATTAVVVQYAGNGCPRLSPKQATGPQLQRIQPTHPCHKFPVETMLWIAGIACSSVIRALRGGRIMLPPPKPLSQADPACWPPRQAGFLLTAPSAAALTIWNAQRRLSGI